MGISKHPSIVTMPKAEKPFPSILGFLIGRFPSVPREIWEKRVAEGKVLDEEARPITLDSGYAPGRRILYFREVINETVIPFTEKILFQDDEILVACKPHFLPVTPGGRYVDECLLNRLRKSTGLRDLAPIHRIDRETAGIVMFSVNKKTRGLYGELFRTGRVGKTLCGPLRLSPPSWKNRVGCQEQDLETGRTAESRLRTAPGAVNARSTINLLEVKGEMACFLLRPLTGKTHQLRIHMSGLGCGILNDRYYPELKPETGTTLPTRSSLLPGMVRFRDPSHRRKEGVHLRAPTLMVNIDRAQDG